MEGSKKQDNTANEKSYKEIRSMHSPDSLSLMFFCECTRHRVRRTLAALIRLTSTACPPLSHPNTTPGRRETQGQGHVGQHSVCVVVGQRWPSVRCAVLRRVCVCLFVVLLFNVHTRAPFFSSNTTLLTNNDHFLAGYPLLAV